MKPTSVQPTPTQRIQSQPSLAATHSSPTQPSPRSSHIAWLLAVQILADRQTYRCVSIQMFRFVSFCFVIPIVFYCYSFSIVSAFFRIVSFRFVYLSFYRFVSFDFHDWWAAVRVLESWGLSHSKAPDLDGHGASNGQ